MQAAPARATPRHAAARGIALALALALSGSAWAAGQVEVNFVEPSRYTDAGQGSFDRDRHLASLAEHMKQLGRQLPDGQTLKLEVLDVDLAGEVWPASIHNLRVLRGRVDWPRITLRYTLADGAREITRGEERLADPAYMFTRRGGLDHGDLPYEKRMLDHWFRERFQPLATAAR
jgi:hypothetical protein